MVIVLLVCPDASVSASDLSRAQIRLATEPGPHYVGQAVGLTLALTAGRDRPEVTPPKLAPSQAILISLGSEFQPLSTSAIGAVVDERNRYTFHFRVVPSHPGTVRIPPLQIRIGERTAASSRTILNIRRLPEAGRPASFLGGVGPVDLTTEVRPSPVRVGQAFEYRVALSGLGSLGSTQPPDLSRLRALEIEPRIEELPTEEILNPPSRVFRYRIRPLRAGQVVLPAVVVSWFDPATAQYMTKASAAHPIRVVDVAAFDTSSLDYEDTPPPHWAWTEILPAALGAAGLLASGAGLAWVRGRRRNRRSDPARLASRLARSLNADQPPEQLAHAVTDGLIAVLHAAVERPPGALTPGEARDCVAQLAAGTDLADRASRLIARCDRMQFAGAEPVDAAERLVCDARALFAALAEAQGGKTERGTRDRP
jgi:hypothetical protein